MRILITGGNGYIGKRLVKRLSGRHEIFILSNGKTTGNNCIEKDIRDPDLDFSGYDVVFHLAAVSLPKTAEKNKNEAWDINVNGTRNIAERIGPGQTLIFISSAHVYDKNRNVAHKEDEALLPGSFYGLTKVVGENLVRYYSKEKRFKHVILRLFNSYSKDQEPGLLIGDVIKKYRENKIIEIINPESLLDMVHLEDVINVLEKANELEQGTYNLCSGHQVSVREVYDGVKAFVGAKDVYEKIASDKKECMLGDNSKLKEKGFVFRKFALDQHEN